MKFLIGGKKKKKSRSLEKSNNHTSKKSSSPTSDKKLKDLPSSGENTEHFFHDESGFNAFNSFSSDAPNGGSFPMVFVEVEENFSVTGKDKSIPDVYANGITSTPDTSLETMDSRKESESFEPTFPVQTQREESLGVVLDSKFDRDKESLDGSPRSRRRRFSRGKNSRSRSKSSTRSNMDESIGSESSTTKSKKGRGLFSKSFRSRKSKVDTDSMNQKNERESFNKFGDVSFDANGQPLELDFENEVDWSKAKRSDDFVGEVDSDKNDPFCMQLEWGDAVMSFSNDNIAPARKISTSNVKQEQHKSHASGKEKRFIEDEDLKQSSSPHSRSPSSITPSTFPPSLLPEESEEDAKITDDEAFLEKSSNVGENVRRQKCTPIDTSDPIPEDVDTSLFENDGKGSDVMIPLAAANSSESIDKIDDENKAGASDSKSSKDGSDKSDTPSGILTLSMLAQISKLVEYGDDLNHQEYGKTYVIEDLEEGDSDPAVVAMSEEFSLMKKNLMEKENELHADTLSHAERSNDTHPSTMLISFSHSNASDDKFQENEEDTTEKGDGQDIDNSNDISSLMLNDSVMSDLPTNLECDQNDSKLPAEKTISQFSDITVEALKNHDSSRKINNDVFSDYTSSTLWDNIIDGDAGIWKSQEKVEKVEDKTQKADRNVHDQLVGSTSLTQTSEKEINDDFDGFGSNFFKTERNSISKSNATPSLSSTSQSNTPFSTSNDGTEFFSSDGISNFSNESKSKDPQPAPQATGFFWRSHPKSSPTTLPKSNTSLKDGKQIPKLPSQISRNNSSQSSRKVWALQEKMENKVKQPSSYLNW
eukprot:CAMPEP_0184868040 /NCGR_PEP_ID=MMETSP0580-20130426/28877_1 /TAXON_ID=1118495 /ORGANISM="Dactyliosolen fragilissimus" /LENGTH=818 /DNA_ID=CAMNT_0027368663 /DNA_START=162 /DNA_END=2615 /DNA_ORIENTATION=-